MTAGSSPAVRSDLIGTNQTKAVCSQYLCIRSIRVKGIGRAIMETLEKDEFALRAKRIEIPASITGLPFYQKMGYSFINGNAELNDERLYRLEKLRKSL